MHGVCGFDPHGAHLSATDEDLAGQNDARAERGRSSVSYRSHNSATSGGEVEDGAAGHHQIHGAFDRGQGHFGPGRQTSSQRQDGKAETAAGTRARLRRMLG